MITTSCSSAKLRQKNLETTTRTVAAFASLNTHAIEGKFSVAQNDPTLYPSSERHRKLFPYPAISCELISSGLEPGNYLVYCPNTGCPFQPEVIQRLVCDSTGQLLYNIPQLAQLLPNCLGFSFVISLWAIPGFCSDWYLLKENSMELYHTTWTYKPIISTAPTGQEIRIDKKESGGNLLEIKFSHFQPQEKIYFFSCSEDEMQPLTATMNDQGEYVYEEFPQVVGKTKGVVTVSVAIKDFLLKASCDWNMKTLEIRRKGLLFSPEKLYHPRS